MKGQKSIFVRFLQKLIKLLMSYRRFADFDLLKTELELFENPLKVDIESQATCFQLE